METEIEKAIQESIEFQVPVKRVKTIRRPRIIKNTTVKNKFDEIQETEAHDHQEENANSCVNSLQRNVVQSARPDVDVCVNSDNSN